MIKKSVKQSFLFLGSCLFILLLANSVSANIIINEIMYNPNQCDSEGYCEWVELYNSGSSTVDLSSWQLEENNFEDINISAREYLIVAHRLNISGGGESFEAYWGNNDSVWNLTDGNYRAIGGNLGDLLNSGELINLSNGTVTKFTINYTQFAALNTAKDDGKTLIWYNNNWTESAYVDGTPGASNDQFVPAFNEWVNPSINNSNITAAYNITVNITDVNNVNVTLINFNGTNYSMSNYLDFWYYEWDTTQNTDGKYSIAAYYNDSLNNKDSNTIYNVTVDNTAPNVSVFNTPANLSNISNTFVINVTVNDATTQVESVYFNITNGSNYVILNSENSLNNFWNASIDSNILEDGQHNITVYANDTMGNWNRNKFIIFLTDNLGPDFFLLNKTPEPSYNNDSVMLNATINDTTTSVSSVWLSGNWTGSWINHSITSVLSQTYNHSVSAGSFENQQIVSYIWYANDTMGNLRNSPLQTFQVQNRAPIFNFSNQVLNISMPEGGVEYRNLTNTFYDLDLDDLNYSSVNSENFTVSINNDTAIATITPASGWYGSGWVVFYAEDFAGGNNQSNNVTITVNSLTNHDPSFSTIPDINFSEDSSYSNLDLSIYCSDSDPNQICANYQLQSLSNSNITITINSTTGTVLINATTPNWYGTVIAKFYVEDNHTSPGADLSNNVLINVTSVNDYPAINYSAGNINQTKDEDFGIWIFDLTIFETDVDVEDTETNLTWSIGSINTSLINATLNTTTDIINFITIPNAHGSNLLQINLTDSHNATTTGSLLITINSVNDIPFINATIGPFTVYDNAVSTFDLTGKANDDNDTSTASLTWDVLDENASLWNYAGTAGGQLILFNAKEIIGINNITDNVTIIVKNSNNTYDTVSVAVTIIPVNDAPFPVSDTGRTPANNSNQTSATNQFKLDWEDSTDPENQTLTYYVFFSNNAVPLFNGTTNIPQYSISNIMENTTYYWNVIASDNVNNATVSTTWQFTTDFDHAPNITAYKPSAATLSINENETISFNATVYDIDGNKITYNWTVNNIQRLTGNTTSYQENITFDYTSLFNESGTNTVKLSIKDTNNNQGTPQSWTVNVANVNREPVLDTISNKNAVEDSELKFNVTASDLDINSLTFTSNISSMALINTANNSLATVSWTPTNDYVGINTVNITVSDSLLTDSQLFTINVTNTNDAPTISSYLPTSLTPTIAETTGSQLFSVTALDIDVGDSLSYVWYKNGTSVSTSSSYTASSLAEGVYNITLIVSDSSSAIATQTWTLDSTINIISNKYSGTITSHTTDEENATGITIETNNGTISFTVSVNLSNAGNLDDYLEIRQGVVSIDTGVLAGLNRSAYLTMNNLNYTKVPLIYYSANFNDIITGSICPPTICSGITYNPSTGILSFDVTGFSTYYTKTNSTNGPPEITSTPGVNATAREAYSYDVTATDPDGDTLVYSLTTSPTGMSISSSSGLISWTPTESQVGIHNITVDVSDTNLSVAQSFNLSVAEAKKLRITELDIKVDGKTDKNLANGETIKREAKPQSEIEFEINVENGFTDEEDLKIEDIVIDISIKDIDDGDDINEESKEFSLNPEKDKKSTIKLKVPLEVDEEIYDVDIHVEGEDENGTKYEIDWTIYLEVKKDKHDIKIVKSNLDPSIVRCGKTVDLNTEIINLGRETEDEATIEITSSDLEFSFRKEDIELEEGTGDNRYSRKLSIAVPDNLKVGIYPIEISSYYDTTHLSDTKTINLEIQECKTIKEETEEVKAKPVVVIKEPAKPEVKPQEEVTKITFRESPAYIALLAISFILTTGILVFALGAAVILLRRK